MEKDSQHQSLGSLHTCTHTGMCTHVCSQHVNIRICTHNTYTHAHRNYLEKETSNESK